MDSSYTMSSVNYESGDVGEEIADASAAVGADCIYLNGSRTEQKWGFWLNETKLFLESGLLGVYFLGQGVLRARVIPRGAAALYILHKCFPFNTLYFFFWGGITLALKT